MGIFQRVMNMTKAAANEMLDKIENPVMMLNHYLRDLDEEISKAEHSAAAQKAQERILQAKLDELNGQVSFYENKAIQAASEDREVDARAALEAKILYADQAEETLKLQQFAKQAAADLELRAASLKEEKIKLQEKRTELVARVRKAEAVPNRAYGASLHGGSAAAQGFERIEQKVLEREAQQELARPFGSHSLASAADVQSEQRNARVEEELQRLLQKSAL
ncbi:PspA/IM30 family protein [Paenibacillus sp. NPDC058071]|uniref:PspA/IM30 family protein n=1 Tax=Paenibacillus sp. NPDC058071 TaxID=3346326 RepID=UPI0036D83B9B